MLKKLLLLVSIVFSLSAAFAQAGQGTIKGKMIDNTSGEPLPFANIIVMQGGNQITGTTTDFDGKFTITALPPGKYNVRAIYVGYENIERTGVIVNSDKITFLDIKADKGIALKEFKVVKYKNPLISKDKTSSGGTVTREAIAKMPGRSAASIAATVGGVFSDGGGMSVRGSRSSSTITYIDGVRVSGSSLPLAAMEQVSVITGGVPAEYGDVTGGIINISTRGVSKNWFGGMEYRTSGFRIGDNVYGLDKFGNNLLGFNISGPLLIRKDSAGNKKDALLGFFLAGELTSAVDPNPSAIGDWKVNDEKKAEIEATPLIRRGGEAGGVLNSGSYLRTSDLEKTPFHINSGSKAINLSGKLDVKTSKTTTLTFGGSFSHSNRTSYSSNFALLNSQNNAQAIGTNWRGWGRFTQRFKNSEDENASLIKNAFISFQVDYSGGSSTSQNKTHKDKLSHYGYIGKFTSTRIDSFSNFLDTLVVVDANGDPAGVIKGYFSTPSTVLYEFEPDSSINPILSNYTANYYNIFSDEPNGNWNTPVDVEGGGALLNGAGPTSIYGLFANVGTQPGGYGYSRRSQFTVQGSGSADIKGHAIKIGFSYEQRASASYNVSPSGLWAVGRKLVNSHLGQRDNTVGTYTSEVWNDNYSRYTFQQKYDAESQTQFDRSLRESLGLEVDGIDWIDFDSYGPDVWDVDFFSPDELLTAGAVGYSGYDYTGKKLTGSSSLNDFFTKKDENDNFTREIGAFKPIYVAGYIQDKFSFEDLIFSIGVRVDRYDANQSVLKDPYTLFPTKTVEETGGTHPSNIESDFVVYVEDVANPSIDDIVGYRDGEIWYNSIGEEISNPAVLHSTGTPQPWLVDPDKTSAFTDLGAESFKDYEPQVNVSPRIAFSFPISDEAGFFTHYDVLTQRPTNNQLQLLNYLQMQSSTATISNPDLKTEKTISYELGFQQALNNYSALKISAFYRENRDMITARQVVGAYPQNYTTFMNGDFSTVKGMTVGYDLRRVGNLSLRANYTLQFADGTGSGSTSSLGLISSGKGSLRTLLPLNVDRRHSFNLSLDYRYRSGKNYNGPVWFGKNVFSDAGANLTLSQGSGIPYTKRTRNTSGSFIDGSINGSRLPWATSIDLKIDKDVNVKWGKGEDEDKKEATINVYLQILNVLNTKSIRGVYSVTGNPDDDGFLGDAAFQKQISEKEDEQSYRDLYAISLANPGFYSMPRRMRLGLQLNF